MTRTGQDQSEQPDPLRSPNVPTRGTALCAEDAGRYLAERIGLAVPFSKHRMWQLARDNALPCLRVGRRVLFRTTVLDAFVACGGTIPGAR